jgi:hypothetical protein
MRFKALETSFDALKTSFETRFCIKWPKRNGFCRWVLQKVVVGFQAGHGHTHWSGQIHDG